MFLLAFLSTCVVTKKRKEQSSTTSTAAVAGVHKGEVATRIRHAPSLGSVTAAVRAAVVPEREPGVNGDHVALVHLSPADGEYIAFNLALADTVDLHARVVHHVIEKTNKWLLVCPDTTTKHAC